MRSPDLGQRGSEKGQLRQEEVECEARYLAAFTEVIGLFSDFFYDWWLLFME